ADRPVAFGVRLAEVAERLLGEHDPPAERVVEAVALVDGDLAPGGALLHKDREIQPCRPTADARDLHGPLVSHFGSGADHRAHPRTRGGGTTDRRLRKTAGGEG